jgi:hypothetical protein
MMSFMRCLYEMASAVAPLTAAGACMIKSSDEVAEQWRQADRVTVAGAPERFRDRCAA